MAKRMAKISQSSKNVLGSFQGSLQAVKEENITVITESQKG